LEIEKYVGLIDNSKDEKSKRALQVVSFILFTFIKSYDIRELIFRGLI